MKHRHALQILLVLLVLAIPRVAAAQDAFYCFDDEAYCFSYAEFNTYYAAIYAYAETEDLFDSGNDYYVEGFLYDPNDDEVDSNSGGGTGTVWAPL